jgi:hypothetical protein
LAGGFGRPILTPVPGAPKVDIFDGVGCCLWWRDVGVFACWIEFVDVGWECSSM